MRNETPNTEHWSAKVHSEYCTKTVICGLWCDASREEHYRPHMTDAFVGPSNGRRQYKYTHDLSRI